VLYQLYHTHIIHISYTYHTRIIHIIHISYTTYAYHTHIIHNICMHRVACTHRSASLRQLRNTHTHTHTHTHTEREQSTSCGVVSYTHHTHIIHNICMHRAACTHRSASLRQLRNTHTHTHTHTKQSIWCGVISHTHHTQHM